MIAVLSIFLIMGALAGFAFLNLYNVNKRLRITVENVATGKAEYVVKDIFGINPRMSSDSKKIVFRSFGKMYLYSLDDGVVKQLLPDQSPINSASWSPDGQNILFVSAKSPNFKMNLLRLQDLSFSVIKEFPAREMVANAYFSPDGKWITFTRGIAKKLYLMTAAGEQEKLLTVSPVFTKAIEDYAWSPASDKIACLTFGKIKLIHLISNVIQEIDVSQMSLSSRSFNQRVSSAGAMIESFKNVTSNLKNIFFNPTENETVYFRDKTNIENSDYLYEVALKSMEIRKVRPTFANTDYSLSKEGKYWVYVAMQWDKKNEQESKTK